MFALLNKTILAPVARCEKITKVSPQRPRKIEKTSANSGIALELLYNITS